MKARRAVGCSTSAALVDRFTRGWFSGSLTADPLRNAKNSHGLLVILTVRRPVRAGPRAHREPASGQKRTPIIKCRKHKATCHASPPTGASPHLARVPTGSSPSRTRTPATGESSVDRQAGRAPSAPHATQSGEGAGRCHGAVCFATRCGDVLSGANGRSRRRPEIYCPPHGNFRFRT
jgi:hypothetical protein